MLAAIDWADVCCRISSRDLRSVRYAKDDRSALLTRIKDCRDSTYAVDLPSQGRVNCGRSSEEISRRIKGSSPNFSQLHSYSALKNGSYGNHKKMVPIHQNSSPDTLFSCSWTCQHFPLSTWGMQETSFRLLDSQVWTVVTCSLLTSTKMCTPTKRLECMDATEPSGYLLR